MHGVSFDVAKAEVVALVGESGSGKTTIARCVGGLHKQWTGELTFEDRPLGKGARARSAEDRKRIQYIFQNPYLSLNPRLTIQQIVGRPMELFGIAKGKAVRDRVVELLDAVALGPTVLPLQTNRLSGGERQRVAIARALAAEPDLLVCDEITSALDVSVQGSIVALLEDLWKTRQISMLFVTHNLALVRPSRAGAGAQRGRARGVRLRRRGARHAQAGLHEAAALQLASGGLIAHRARVRQPPSRIGVGLSAGGGDRSASAAHRRAPVGPGRVPRGDDGIPGARRRVLVHPGTPTARSARSSSGPRPPSPCSRTSSGWLRWTSTARRGLRAGATGLPRCWCAMSRG